jgi:hypothetical protein
MSPRLSTAEAHLRCEAPISVVELSRYVRGGSVTMGTWCEPVQTGYA